VHPTPIGLPTGLRPEPSLAILTGILSLAYPTVGALIVSRLPANPIGWLFCSAGLLSAVRPFTVAYADYALLEDPALPGEDYLAWFSSWEWFALPTLAVCLVLLHRARGDERQQIKWFMYAAVPLSVFGSVEILQVVVQTFTTTFLFNTVYMLPSRQIFNAIDYVTGIALLFVPVFTYVAMLKYRLYNMDLVINRALVYGSLTILLALIYFGGVTATQAVVQALTGQEELPQLVIVASTS
jgi:hypothetical protein